MILLCNIICICGLEGSGKSTAARFLAAALKRRGKSVKIFSFAEPLKYLARQHFNIFKEASRDALEELAMDMRRVLGNSVFTHVTIDDIQSSTYDYYIIDDIRYNHEWQALDAIADDLYIARANGPTHERSLDMYRFAEFLDSLETVIPYDLPIAYNDLYVSCETLVTKIAGE